MNDYRVGHGAFFDRGINSITFKHNDAAQGLPQLRTLSPAEEAGQPMLDKLLHRPDMGDYLQESVRPAITDRDLLLPTNFRQTMNSCLASLRQAAQSSESSDPEKAKLLGRAVRLLNEESSLRDLLQMYRSALYQG